MDFWLLFNHNNFKYLLLFWSTKCNIWANFWSIYARWFGKIGSKKENICKKTKWFLSAEGVGTVLNKKEIKSNVCVTLSYQSRKKNYCSAWLSGHNHYASYLKVASSKHALIITCVVLSLDKAQYPLRSSLPSLSRFSAYGRS